MVYGAVGLGWAVVSQHVRDMPRHRICIGERDRRNDVPVCVCADANMDLPELQRGLLVTLIDCTVTVDYSSMHGNAHRQLH